MNKIYTWIKRCDTLALNEKVEEYQSSNLPNLFKELEVIRNHSFDQQELTQLLNKYGIYLVIESALTGTKIRGCTMVKNQNPAIYMTKYYKEKASFYFTLYHELGHVKKRL